MSVFDADIRTPEGWQVFLYGLAAFAIGVWVGTNLVARPAFAHLPTTFNGAVEVPQYLELAGLVNMAAFAVSLVAILGVVAIDYWVIGDE